MSHRNDSRRCRTQTALRAAVEGLERRQLLTAVHIGSAAVSLPIALQNAAGYSIAPDLGGGGGNLDVGLTSPSSGTLTPAQVHGAYGLTNLSFGSTAANGAGETIAILDFGDDAALVNSTASNFSTSDLAIFDSKYGLPNPPSFTKMGFDDNSLILTPTLPASGVPYGTVIETSLDVEWAHAMAPSANILLVEGDPDGDDIFNGVLAIDAAASSMHIVAVSMSFGFDEGGEYGVLDSTANAEGVDGYYFDTPSLVYVAATGDSGPYDSDTATIDSDFPASSSNVLAAGGTTLSVSGTSWANETTWGNGTRSGTYGGGGGGFSVYEPQPAYQAGAVNGLSSSARTYPDISLDANPNSGVAVYDSPDYGAGTGWVPSPVGGTSLATPLLAGIVAVADQGRVLYGKSPLASSGGAGVSASNPNGNPSTLDIHSLLYGFGYSNSDFHDVTGGSSIGPGSYGPLTGYDLSTGLGSPNGSHLVPDLIGNTGLSLSGPQWYLRLDPDLVHLDIYAANSATGAIYESLVASSVGPITITGTGSPESVTVDFTNGDPIAGGLTFNASGTAANNQLIVVGTAAGSDAIVSSSGKITENGIAITSTDVSVTSFTPGAGTDSLNVSSGTLQLTRPAGSSILPQNFSSILIGPSAKLAVAAPAAHAARVLVNTATLTLGGNIGAWTGTLDLSGNDLAVTSGNLFTLSNAVASGYAAGLWTGTGIDSSAAAADSTHLSALGTIVNNAPGVSPLFGAGTTLGTFDTTSPPAAAILIKYTYYGDANLTGKVDGSDYSLIDNGLTNRLTNWYNGNFNYDSLVDGSDYALIDNSYNTQGASQAAEVAATISKSTSPKLTAVPVVFSRTLVEQSWTSPDSIAGAIFSSDSDEIFLRPAWRLRHVPETETF